MSQRVPAQKLCAISIDLDEIPNYFAIHGLQATAGAATLVYDVALPRFQRWAQALDVPLTLFAIARDTERTRASETLRAMLQAGHEIGNHTLDHRYDLTRLPEIEMQNQIVGAQNLLEHRVGVRPKGFRAPGYTMSDAVYRILEAQAFTYSSSVFPCPAYYLAKLAAIEVKRWRGRRSASVVGDPNVLRIGREPYRVNTPYWRLQQPADHASNPRNVVEVPIHTTPGLRLPFIGTALTLLGPRGARLLTHQVRHDALVNLELHGIDLLDASDGLAALASVQPDVRIPLKRKLDTLNGVVQLLRENEYRFMTLDRAVGELVFA